MLKHSFYRLAECLFTITHSNDKKCDIHTKRKPNKTNIKALFIVTSKFNPCPSRILSGEEVLKAHLVQSRNEEDFVNISHSARVAEVKNLS